MARRKKSHLTSSSNVLQALLENGKSPLSSQFIRWKLWRNWKEVVGPTMGSRCEPVGYKGGILYIWVTSSTWMQQLSFMANPLREKINEYVGRRWVSQVRFTLDRRSVPTFEEADNKIKDFLAP